MLMRCCWQNRFFVAPKVDHRGTVGDRIYDRHLSVTSATGEQGSGPSSRDDKDKHQNRKFVPRTKCLLLERTRHRSNNGAFFEELPARAER